MRYAHATQRFSVAWIVCAGLAALGPGAAEGQNYPNRPIRMIAPEVGGGNDFVARLLAQGLTALLGQQVVVDNRGGAGGIIAAQLLAKAPPDGYTLLFYSSGIWTTPLMQASVPYDVLRDFAPVSAAASSPNLVVVHPSLDVKSIKELIALAQARPGVLNYASGSSASANHLAAELFKAAAGINIVRVAYKGTGPALNDVVAGHVPLMFPAAGSAASHVRAGRLRALAVTSAAPSALAPNLPTVAASGLPGFEAVALSGIFAPAKTPATLISDLNHHIVRVLSTSDVKEKLLQSGAEAVAGPPQEFAARIRTEMVKLAKVIKDAGVRAD